MGVSQTTREHTHSAPESYLIFLLESQRPSRPSSAQTVSLATFHRLSTGP